MEGFFNTEMITFTVLPNKLICMKRAGFQERRFELPPIPADENPVGLKVNIDKHTVYGEKYIYLDGVWKEIGE